MSSRRYTVVVADRKSGVVRRFTLPFWPAACVIASLAATPILLGLGARWSAQAAIDELQISNAALRLENENYREATVQLSMQISALQTAVDDIGTKAAVDPAATRAMAKLPAVVKSRAMGGAAAAVAPVLETAVDPAGSALKVLRDLLGVLENRLESVRSGVERRQVLAAATPSIWPVAGWLSSAYGSRRDPFTGGPNFHPGLDISANYGEQVFATADGTISTAAANGAYGNMVSIDHGFGITTRYAHLSRFAVQNGQQVARGDVIGYVGSSGRSTSPHLHYEIWMNGRLMNPLRLLGPR